MAYTRREFGKLALAGLPAAAVLGRSDSIIGASAQAKPNSKIEGVQIGTITYSYRSMPDQSAEATLKYILESGISAVELMGGPIESYAGVTIYATKILSPNMSDEEFEYVFNVAEALVATHTTLELPTDDAQLKR